MHERGQRGGVDKEALEVQRVLFDSVDRRPEKLAVAKPANVRQVDALRDRSHDEERGVVAGEALEAFEVGEEDDVSSGRGGGRAPEREKRWFGAQVVGGRYAECERSRVHRWARVHNAQSGLVEVGRSSRAVCGVHCGLVAVQLGGRQRAFERHSVLLPDYVAAVERQTR